MLASDSSHALPEQLERQCKPSEYLISSLLSQVVQLIRDQLGLPGPALSPYLHLRMLQLRVLRASTIACYITFFE